jgi:hypothetical protein
MKALFTVTEGHIGREMRGEGAGSERFADSVGIGYYRIDLHPSTSGRGYVDIDCFPFQIPLRSLVPAGMDNLLGGAKNIGTTHISNGAYRLHPVEWSIGEAAAVAASEALRRGAGLRDLASDDRAVGSVQEVLSDRLGVALAWPDEIRTAGSTRHPIPLAML